MKAGAKPKTPATRKAQRDPPSLTVELSKTRRELADGFIQDMYTVTCRFKGITWTAPLDAQTIPALWNRSPLGSFARFSRDMELPSPVMRDPAVLSVSREISRGDADC